MCVCVRVCETERETEEVNFSNSQFFVPEEHRGDSLFQILAVFT